MKGLRLREVGILPLEAAITTWKSLRHWPALVAVVLLTGKPQRVHLMFTVEAGLGQVEAGSCEGSLSRNTLNAVHP